MVMSISCMLWLVTKLLSIMKNLAMLCKLAMISGYASVDSRFLLSISGWKVTVFLCFASVNMIVQRSYPMVRIYLVAVSCRSNWCLEPIPFIKLIALTFNFLVSRSGTIRCLVQTNDGSMKLPGLNIFIVWSLCRMFVCCSVNKLVRLLLVILHHAKINVWTFLNPHRTWNLYSIPDFSLQLIWHIFSCFSENLMHFLIEAIIKFWGSYDCISLELRKGILHIRIHSPWLLILV